MKVHHVKAHPEIYREVVNGSKNFEYRKNDREYMAGDKIVLCEWGELGYTGRQCEALIGYVLYGPAFGVPVGYCVFSLLNPAIL